MSFFAKQSIRRKLMLVILLTTGGALLLSSISFLVSDWYSLRSSIVERLRAQAAIVGNSSVSAMVFGDNQSAIQTLSILEQEANIQAAGLFDNDGKLFARYERTPGTLLSQLPDADSGDINDLLFVTLPISFDRNPVGRILLIADMGAWKHSQLANITTALMVFTLSLLVAILLSSWLQRLVSEPVLKLAKTARKISQHKDYSLRAKKDSQDEIGNLVDDFNHMLEQIQYRDQELYQINEKLEEKVDDRTRELKELTKQLEHQVNHDALTGLPNRTTFDNDLHIAIAQKRRYGGQVAVLFMDLDRFKIINDTLGHAMGDKLLIKVAEVFKNSVRESDTLARLGGDEFAVLLPEIEHSNTAMVVAGNLAKAISKPLLLDGHELHLSTSIGISTFPDDGSDAETIVTNADTAMYSSKERGRNQVTFYSSEMNARTQRRLALETKLREAVRDNLFKIYYQPRFDVNTLEIVGVEALLRWFDSEDGNIPPEDFIYIAEECGLIASIDEWVLETACRDILQIQRDSGYCLSLAVNFSPAQFIRKDLDKVIGRILEKTKFPGELLELEITESLFGPSNTDVYRIFDLLEDMNIKIAIDDFGTSYSSLSRLKQLPLHTLKIDKSFIRDLGKDTDYEIITQTIITMAHSLNLHVVAEGVENDLQYQFIKSNGCDSLQGFMFAHPMPIDELAKLLEKNAAMKS